MCYIFAKSYIQYYLKLIDDFTFLLMKIWKIIIDYNNLMLKEKSYNTPLFVVYLVKIIILISKAL